MVLHPFSTWVSMCACVRVSLSAVVSLSLGSFSEFSCFSQIYYVSLHCLDTQPLRISMGISKRRSLFWGTVGQHDAGPLRAALNGVGLPHQSYRPWAKTTIPKWTCHVLDAMIPRALCQTRAQDLVLPIQQHLPVLFLLHVFTKS